MFDTTKPFKARIFSGTEKACVLNYPTDKQWIDLAAQKRSILRRGTRSPQWEDLGDHRALDLDLLGAIAIDQSAGLFDGHEAAKVIERLSVATAITVERDMDRFIVELEVYGGALVRHTLNMPTEQQQFDLERSSTLRKPTAKGTVMEVALKPSADLWAALKGEASGYAEGSQIPVVHKTNALAAVINHVREMENLPGE